MFIVSFLAEERCIRVLDNKTLEIAPPGGSLAIRSQTQNAKAMQYTFTKVFDETVSCFFFSSVFCSTLLNLSSFLAVNFCLQVSLPSEVIV